MSRYNNNISINEQHPFHLVNPSPWPFITSFTVFFFIVNFVCYLHNISLTNNLSSALDTTFKIVSFVLLLASAFSWFRDIHIEAITGHHTEKVQNGLRAGMILFIVSEVMFFFGFFWAFFHCSLAPSVAIGAIWPPVGIEVLNPWGLPLLNTVILLSSGVSITWAHRALIIGGSQKARQDVLTALIITISFGIIFTLCQLYEYSSAPFSINDGIYGSIFYMATGFHGFHVLIGTIFLIVTFFRHIFYHFTATHHVGFEAAAWYWHFVDVVWIFLYIMIYCWGS